MGKERRYFSDEFKTDAVRRVIAGDEASSQIARTLGVHPSLLQSWKRKLGPAIGKSHTKVATPSSLEEEVRRLRRENAILKEDREILKKAAAFFAKEPR